MNTYVKFTFVLRKEGKTDTVDFVVCEKHVGKIDEEHRYYTGHSNVASATRPTKEPSARPCTFCPKESR